MDPDGMQDPIPFSHWEVNSFRHRFCLLRAECAVRLVFNVVPSEIVQIDRSNQYLKIRVQLFSKTDATSEDTENMIMSVHFRRRWRLLHLNRKFPLETGRPAV